MRIKVLTMAAVSSLSLLASAVPALAGGCMNGVPNCNVGVNVIPSAPAQFGPMTVRTNHPLGHLRQVEFQRAPNVSITRIHSMLPTATLSDAPSGFTGGCHPTSTQYCRSNVGTPVSVSLAPAPTQPVYTGRTFTGQGYDPSKFQPRQYGDNTFTPGIAHLPTSYVDRSPANAQAVLNSGRAVSQPLASGGITPAYGQTAPLTGAAFSGSVAPFQNRVAYSAPAPVIAAPFGAQATAPVLTGNGTYASNVGADGTYWEKASGPRFFGDTLATQVICKRKLPTQVVNPVVNVPYAVPTPVAVCGPAPHAAHAGHNLRYGQPQGRWVQ